MPNDEHHDNRYEDGEPYTPRVAAIAYSEWDDADAYDVTDPKHPGYHDLMAGYSDNL